MIYDSKFASFVAELATGTPEHPRLLLFTQPNFHTSSEWSPNSHKDYNVWPSTEHDVAYIHHSSGTSGNLPKPLPVTHQMAVGVLPVMLHKRWKEASFSTTPLYHGGVADCFRAWTSSSMIWLFPGELPITASNILSCISATSIAVDAGQGQQVTWFSCVPQVLNFITESAEGLAVMKGMKLVGVGGAAMPEKLGNDLVHADVNLVSRFGSTECGFLLTSHRDYPTDKAWQYLRQPAKSPVRFEDRGSGQSELIVLSDWPALEHHNRPDGSFATADLFEPHPTIKFAWKFHSRADAQLTLNTGKKFDPTSFEDSVRQSPLLQDVLIFGNDRPYPGALLFRSDSGLRLGEKSFIDQIWLSMDAENGRNPEYARLPRSMLKVMPSSSAGLEKSSKGTTQRKKAQKLYEREIEDAYANEATNITKNFTADPSKHYADADVNGVILSIMSDFLKTPGEIDDEADFFELGIDSGACIRIRALVQKLLIPLDLPQLPLNVVYDCGNITRLSGFIVAFRHGKNSSVGPDEHELQLMESLVPQFSAWDASLRPFPEPAVVGRPVVLLTGVTGTLGAHILSQLCSSSTTFEVHCLVRASDTTAAVNRVVKGFAQRKMPPLDVEAGNVYFHTCQLSKNNLGLSENTYQNLSHRTTLVIHAAWAVNFTMRLSSFVKEHVAGLYNLINFALSAQKDDPPQFLFCSSTASVLGSNGLDAIPELISHDPLQAASMGYSRSKWVAEAICEQAHLKTSLRDRIKVLRIGQLCGDSERGVWNVTEAWPLMLSSSKITNCLPDLGSERLDWLPVDVAAEAVLQIARSRMIDRALNSTTASKGVNNETNAPPTCPVYHVTNYASKTTWSDLLGWIQKLSPNITVIGPTEWLTRLEGLEQEGSQHPALKLLGLWRKNYGRESTESTSTKTILSTNNACEEAPVMREVAPQMEEEYFGKIWEWLKVEMEREEGGETT